MYSDRRIVKISTHSPGLLKTLKAGDEVFLSGDIYTARDQAHKRLAQIIKQGGKLPLDLKGAFIYYCGPTQRPPKRAIGSCGPTTSSRMDTMTAPLLEAGLAAMIGKGRRGEEVRRAIKKHKAVYFLAPGGAGAYLARRVVSAKPVHFKELGPEAIYKLRVKDFPLIVGIDAAGADVFDK